MRNAFRECASASTPGRRAADSQPGLQTSSRSVSGLATAGTVSGRSLSIGKIAFGQPIRPRNDVAGIIYSCLPVQLHRGQNLSKDLPTAI
jgi:hypothetical protein